MFQTEVIKIGTCDISAQFTFMDPHVGLQNSSVCSTFEKICLKTGNNDFCWRKEIGEREFSFLIISYILNLEPCAFVICLKKSLRVYLKNMCWLQNFFLASHKIKIDCESQERISNLGSWLPPFIWLLAPIFQTLISLEVDREKFKEW